MSLRISLCDLPSVNRTEEIKTKWNLGRPGGWVKYEEATNNIAGKIIDIVDNEGDIEEVIIKVEKLQEKSKFIAFNKTKIRQRKLAMKECETIKAKELLARQSEQIERDILEIKSNTKGRAAKVFKMKTRLDGSNKAAQDAHAIKDPRTGELLVTTQEIKRATLEYNCQFLKNNVAEEGFEELVKLKTCMIIGWRINLERVLLQCRTKTLIKWLQNLRKRGNSHMISWLKQERDSSMQYIDYVEE